jgi:hypothetical protein
MAFFVKFSLTVYVGLGSNSQFAKIDSHQRPCDQMELTGDNGVSQRELSAPRLKATIAHLTR